LLETRRSAAEGRTGTGQRPPSRTTPGKAGRFRCGCVTGSRSWARG